MKLLSCVGTFYTKREIRHFHVTGKKCTKKRDHVQSCCFVNLHDHRVNLLLFCRSRSQSSLLNKWGLCSSFSVSTCVTVIWPSPRFGYPPILKTPVIYEHPL